MENLDELTFEELMVDVCEWPRCYEEAMDFYEDRWLCRKHLRMAEEGRTFDKWTS